MTKGRQKGVSLIITIFIMVIILSVVLSVSTLLYGEIKVMRNIGDSVVSLFTADSGVEKVLYYDKQVMPILSAGTSCSSDSDCVANQTCANGTCLTHAVRGLCAMFPYNPVDNPTACPQNAGEYSGLDSSIYCNNATVDPLNSADCVTSKCGCDPGECDNCVVSFTGALDSSSVRTYSVTAQVSPSEDGSTDFEIKSRGVFSGTERQLDIKIVAPKNNGAITVENACTTTNYTQHLNSTPQGETINVSADVVANALGDTISKVTATIYYYNSMGNTVIAASNLPLGLTTGSYSSGHWQLLNTWSTTNVQAYYADLDATDSLSPYNEQKCKKLWPEPLCLTVCQ